MNFMAFVVLTLWLAGVPAWGREFLTAQDFRSDRLSGFNLYTADTLHESDFIDLKSMGARIARYHLRPSRCVNCDYFRFPAKGVQRFDQLLAWAENADVQLILVLDPVPERELSEIWTNPKLQDSIVKLWGLLAGAYKNNPTVAGYDIMNEPVPPASSSVAWEDKDPEQWRQLAQRIVAAIRAVDSRHVVFYEPSPLAAPHAFKTLRPLADSNVVYTFHLYEPHRVTHQGIQGRPNGIRYPGAVPNIGVWDRNRLSQTIQPVREFSRKYGVPIMLTEFSCSRGAPGDSRERYLTDVLDLVGDEHWPWLYHGFRVWEGWDPELPSNDRESRIRKADTPAIVLIKQRLGARK